MSIFDRIKKFLKKFNLFSFPDKKKPTFVHLKKSACNPIICPSSENNWEAWQTFNPGVILLDNKIHFLYRAIGTDGASRLGYASSEDGFTIEERLDEPVYRHKKGEGEFTIHSFNSGGSFGGAEDPRIVRVGNSDKLHVTYTAFDDGIRVGLTSIKVDDFLNKNWDWDDPSLISPPGEVHKNWTIFPEKINGKYVILHSINPEIQVEYRDSLEFEKGDYIESEFGGLERTDWDKWVRGAGAPPIETKDGWLLLYHAMSEGEDKYKVGAFILDKNDPTKILHRAKAPVMEPDKLYENEGHKAGVVYVSGAVVKDGKLIVYYGGADSFVCGASAPLDEFLESIKEGVSPRLKSESINN